MSLQPQKRRQQGFVRVEGVEGVEEGGGGVEEGTNLRRRAGCCDRAITEAKVVDESQHSNAFKKRK